MGNKELQLKKTDREGEDKAVTSSHERREDIKFVNDTFNLKHAVERLHIMMEDITKEEMSAKTVNAACHCIHQLNETIDTAIKAARFLREK